jgi:TRAP-type mannitol/chloroaromatic compound transport system permease large subunit
VFIGGWETAIDRNPSFVVNRMNERVLWYSRLKRCLPLRCSSSWVLTLERSKIADDLLTTMVPRFRLRGLAVPLLLGAFLGGATGIVGATVVTMGLLSCQPCCGRLFRKESCDGCDRAFQAPQQIIPPVRRGSRCWGRYDFQRPQARNPRDLWLFDALTHLVHPWFCP